jgi:hypothetical protein
MPSNRRPALLPTCVDDWPNSTGLSKDVWARSHSNLDFWWYEAAPAAVRNRRLSYYREGAQMRGERPHEDRRRAQRELPLGISRRGEVPLSHRSFPTALWNGKVRPKGDVPVGRFSGIFIAVVNRNLRRAHIRPHQAVHRAAARYDKAALPFHRFLNIAAAKFSYQPYVDVA